MRTAMKVATVLSRNSSQPAFSPLDIAGLQRYYHRPTGAIASATDGTGAVAADGMVAYWQDLSANAQHATQTTEAKRPLWRDDHAILGDSIEAVSADALTWATGISFQDFTWFFDVSLDTVNTDKTLLGNSSVAGANVQILSATTFRIVTNAAQDITIPALVANTRYIITARRSGTGANNIRIYVNGLLAGQGSSDAVSATFNQLMLRSASSDGFDGAMKAALLYNVALTDDERASVSAFLAA